MLSESTKFDIMQFFTSAKGRLNRQPYNILVIIITVLALMIYALLMTTSPRSITISALIENVEKLCIEASERYGKDLSMEEKASSIKKCIAAEAPKAIKATPHNAKILIPAAGVLLLWLLTICPAIKRLHDRGKSGWWYLGFCFVTLIPYLNIIVYLWFVVETSFLRGTVGPNEYGPDPLA